MLFDIIKMFPLGTSVDVEPMDDDVFSHEFSGTVVGHNKGYIQVKDQDDNVFDVEPCQVSFNKV